MVAALLAGGTLSLALAAADDAPSNAARPNVVIMLADDLGYGDLGCFGHPDVKTPHLDALAKQGVRLTQCYIGGVVCSPSRASLLTGRHPFRAGIYDWIPEGSPMHLRESELTLPKLLHAAGYQTCHAGKWHLNGQFNNPAQPQPNQHGYDWWLATQNNAAPSHAQPANFVRNGAAVGKVDDHSALFVAREAADWLKTKRDPQRPFLLCVWTHEPHYPIQAAQRFRDLYPGEQDPQRREYLADVSQMDAGFGLVLQTLDELKLAANTVVIFSSDNGPEGNGKTTPGRGETGGLRGRKRDVEEGGIRVPGIIRWPGTTAAGGESAVPVINRDFLPTVLAAAGIALPAGRRLDGVDLRPALAGQPLARSTPLFWNYKGKAALREGDWKLIAPAQGPPQLYNLAVDRGEAKDVSAEHPERTADLHKQLQALTAEITAEGPQWPAGPKKGKKAAKP